MYGIYGHYIFGQGRASGSRHGLCSTTISVGSYQVVRPGCARAATPMTRDTPGLRSVDFYGCIANSKTRPVFEQIYLQEPSFKRQPRPREPTRSRGGGGGGIGDIWYHRCGVPVSPSPEHAPPPPPSHPGHHRPTPNPPGTAYVPVCPHSRAAPPVGTPNN